uniref:EF-hand domain-containing protein n=1 Tax=Brassica oleracea var. oleracea TaxID=109376 RepID=A0A0D3BGH7_BRAOL
MIDDSEVLYKCLIEEGEEYLLEKSEMKGYDECTKMECRKMIKVFDENRDGKIDFDEFVKLIDKSFS